MTTFVAWLFIFGLSVAAYVFVKKLLAKRDLSLLPKQFIVADIETTGLDPYKHEIIEIAAIRVNRDSKTHDTITVLVKPQGQLPKKITDLTGITVEMLERDGESLEKAISDFLAFIGDHRLVFYNAPFDLPFLIKAAGRYQKRIKNPVSDALDMARRAWPDLKSYKLTDVARSLNIKGAHRALKDCELTVTVYCAATLELRRLS